MYYVCVYMRVCTHACTCVCWHACIARVQKSRTASQSEFSPPVLAWVLRAQLRRAQPRPSVIGHPLR